METNEFPLVSIWCLVYNHEPYLRQCLDGFVMQNTNFKFEAIVHDDVSTDSSAAIIREYAEKYPDIIKPIFETENQYSKRDGSLERIMHEACKGKYIAICEGDDYWIDPLKLQKQVDYLLNHEDCGLVYTAYRQRNDLEKTTIDIITSSEIKHDVTFKWSLLEQKVMVGTCTAMVDSILLEQIRSFRDDFDGYMMGDTQIWFNAARMKNVGYIPEITAVYRKQPTGATSCFETKSRIKFIQNCQKAHLHLAYKYGAPIKTIENIKEVFGYSLIQLYTNIADYDSALKINANNLKSSFIISLIIWVSKLLRLRKPLGMWRFYNLKKRL